MKKGLLIFLLFLLSFTSGFAQLRHEQQSQIGLHAGLNYSSLYYGREAPQGYEEPWVPGLTLGLATSFWANDWFAFAPEINYSQRGYEIGVSDVISDRNYSYRYHFVEVPLLFRATFGRQILRVFVNAGPTVSYLLGGKETAEVNGAVTETSIESEDEMYNYFEVGAAFGGGLHINTGVGSFLLGLRYHRAFTERYADDHVLPVYEGVSDAPSGYKGRYLSISLIFLGPYRE